MPINEHRKMIVGMLVDAGKTSPKAMGLESLDIRVFDKNAIYSIDKNMNEKCDVVIAISENKDGNTNKVGWIWHVDMGVALQKMMEMCHLFGVDYGIKFHLGQKLTGCEESIALGLSFGRSKNIIRK